MLGNPRLDQLAQAGPHSRLAGHGHDAPAHCVLATAPSGSDQESEALPEYRKAAELEPKNPTYLDHLAVSLDLNGDSQAAIAQLQKAIAIEPLSPEYQFNLGVVLESRGDFAGAVEPLRRSVDMSRGRNWRSFAELAKAYDKSGHPADAVRAALQAVSLAEQARDGDNETALRQALAGYQRDAANTAPQNRPVVFWQAEMCCMGILRGPGTNGLLLAACLGLAGTAHAACNGPQALVAQLHAHPTTENAVKLGSWYATRQQFDCAAETLRAALEADPNSAQLHYLVGLALIEGKHPDEAIPELQKSVHLAPDETKPRLLLASAYEKAGKHDEAEEQWKQSLRIDPKSEIALEGLATDLIAREDYVDAVKLLHSAPRTEKLTIKLSQALGLLSYLDEAAVVLN